MCIYTCFTSFLLPYSRSLTFPIRVYHLTTDFQWMEAISSHSLRICVCVCVCEQQFRCPWINLSFSLSHSACLTVDFFRSKYYTIFVILNGGVLLSINERFICNVIHINCSSSFSSSSSLSYEKKNQNVWTPKKKNMNFEDAEISIDIYLNRWILKMV